MFIPERLQTKILMLVSVLFFAACSSQMPANAPANSENTTAGNANYNSNAAKDDPAELNSIVTLPFVPVDPTFREETDQNDPDNRKLVAVLKFEPEDARNLIEQAQKHRQPEAVQVGTEDWFPAELVAQTQLSGDEMLKGTAYGANDFLRMPYRTGRLIKVENSDYFILELSTN
jgi:hypothetical protein